MKIKNTLVLGASLNESRYSNKAIKNLNLNQIKVFAIGKNSGETHGIKIQNDFPKNILIDTVTIYLNINLQDQYTNRIIELSPNRVIFNPGAENPKLYNLFLSKGIKCENSCTLVLLSTKQY